MRNLWSKSLQTQLLPQLLNDKFCIRSREKVIYLYKNDDSLLTICHFTIMIEIMAMGSSRP